MSFCVTEFVNSNKAIAFPKNGLFGKIGIISVDTIEELVKLAVYTPK